MSRVMSNQPLPPDPEQVVPPKPVPQQRIIGVAAGVVLVVIAVVLILRLVFKPDAPGGPIAMSLPVLGDTNAPVTIYEYGSFACEHCAHIQPVVQEVMSRYEGKVKLVFINFVLGQAANQLRAAQAGICAAEQRRFWEFERIMFERQKSWVQDPNPVPLWLNYASQAGIDTNRLFQCIDSEKTQRALQEQTMMGAGQMVQRTPTFLIGDKRLVNPASVDEFAKIIDEQLKTLKKE